MPILEGPPGFDKTSGFKLLFSFDDESWTGRVSFKNLDQKDKLIGMGEGVPGSRRADGMGDSSVESIKAFLDMQSDNFRPPYEVVAQEHPRTFVFGGTTNRELTCPDETGARQFWPMKVHGPVDKAAIARDLRQLWAEAAHLEAGGMDSILPRDLWHASDRRAAAQTVKDDITVRLDEILGTQEELLRLQIQVERTDVLMEFGEEAAMLAEVARLYSEGAGEDVSMDEAEVFGALACGPITRIGSELRIGSSRLADCLNLTSRHKGTFGKIRNHMTRRGWEYRDMVRSPRPGAGYVKRV
ncbi:MAG: VapE family protein [Isosphaeraceae bacterium]